MMELSVVTKPGKILLETKKLLGRERLEPLVKLLLLIIGIAIIVIAWKKGLIFDSGFHTLLKQHNPILIYIFIFSSAVFLGSLVLRTYLWFKYRPYDSRLVEAWPEVTVIVPSYNEGDTVIATISSIANSDYPADKLKIVAIDDGSTDDTYDYLLQAKELFPDMLNIIRFEKNKGKRDGIYAGFKNCSSPLIITVDSDTKLETYSIKEILTPLILNATIGAVTGNIKVWQEGSKILPKMLKVHFAMAFEYARAVQSTFSCVFCTSGAFSAYRSSILSEVIDEWRTQTFLRQRCTIGEDQSLTNYFLAKGAGTAFQIAAIAHTKVPDRLPKVLNMMLRWARGSIRESIIFSRLMFNSKRKGNYLLPFIEFCSTIAILFLHIILFYYFLFQGFVDGDFLFRSIAYCAISGFLYMLYYIRLEGVRDCPYILMFSLFSAVFVVGIFTFATFTVTEKSWSTR